MSVSFRRILKSTSIGIYRLLPRALRALLNKRKVVILVYHEIAPHLFSDHLAFLSARYSVISLRDYSNFLNDPNYTSLPPNPLIITFDDGWKSNYKLMTIVKSYGLPVTIFLATGLVGTSRKIWNYILDRCGAEKALNAYLKGIANTEKDETLLKLKGHYPRKEYGHREFLSIDEIREMTPYFDFQAHSVFHPVLTMCSDSEITSELVRSKAYIDDFIGNDCFAFAYPYGLCGEREAALVAAAGYCLARTANRPALNTSRSNRFLLSSIGIGQEDCCKRLENKILWAELKSMCIL